LGRTVGNWGGRPQNEGEAGKCPKRIARDAHPIFKILPKQKKVGSPPPPPPPENSSTTTTTEGFLWREEGVSGGRVIHHRGRTGVGKRADVKKVFWSLPLEDRFVLLTK